VGPSSCHIWGTCRHFPKEGANYSVVLVRLLRDFQMWLAWGEVSFVSGRRLAAVDGGQGYFTLRAGFVLKIPYIRRA